MKVSHEQAARNRVHVVDVAGTQFRKHGFDGIGVADLMKAAGLTHGGFYNNFPSKNALAVEAVARVFAETRDRLREVAVGAADPLAAIIGLYLSPAHRDALEVGCVVAALSQDATRGSPELRSAFEAGIEGYLDLMVEFGKVSRGEAMSIYATMLGALTLSRTVVDPATSDEILSSAVESLLRRKE